MVWVYNSALGFPFELGLSTEPIRIIPKLRHLDIRTDDFGTDVPAEVLSNCLEAYVMMQLVHFDRDILEICVAEANGGMGFRNPDGTPAISMGVCGSAGTPMGGGKPLGDPANHYTMLFLECLEGQPWRFPSCYIMGDPFEIPVGTAATIVQLAWRAIPYKPLIGGASNPDRGQINSIGTIVFDHIDIFPDEFENLTEEDVMEEESQSIIDEILNKSIINEILGN